MPEYTERRTPALYRSTTAPPTPYLGYTTGDVPPELSPLDELAIRGRMLKKQLGNDGTLGLNPQTVHRSLRHPNRSPGAAPSGFLERSFSLDSQQQSIGSLVGGIGIHFTSPNEQDRPVSSYPRFSHAASIVSSRNSNASVLTVTPDGTKSPEPENIPNFHGFDFRQESGLPNLQGHSSRPGPKGLDSRVGRQGYSEVTKNIEEDRTNSLTAAAVLPTQRDPSLGRGNRPPKPPNVMYQAYNPNIHGPARQISKDDFGSLRAPPPRSGSRDSRDSSNGRSPSRSPILHLSRTGSGADNDARNETPKSAVSLLSASPEIMGPSTPNIPNSTQPPNISKSDNYDWLHDYPTSSAPTSPRPPSASSQRSISNPGGSRSGSKAINFSRPMLSVRPTTDSLVAQDSLRSPHPSDHSPLQTPIGRPETPIGTAETYDGEGVTSYTYTKFYLPRGRALDRNSLVILDEPPKQQPQQQYKPPQTSTQSQPEQQPRRPSYTAYTPSAPIKPINKSPSSPGTSSRLEPTQSQSDYVSHVLRQQSQQPPNPQRPTTSSAAPRSSHLGPPGSISPNPNRSPGAGLQPSKLARPALPKDNMAPAASLTPDEHVTLGIECHENGSLQESAYHLRHAANAGHPTGMLLYALSVRHGWGMRANPQEAIVWLKKVIRDTGNDPADNDVGTAGLAGDFFEKQGLKAQYALSIYELGMCHLNGWGTNVDKTYALKCFEMAGKLGDADALSEAGYCYYHGVGTKKDLKKSAKYYRMAEARGVNMVGNSWIWKEKYLDDEDRREKARKEGKAEPAAPEKSGSFFGRRKDKH